MKHSFLAIIILSLLFSGCAAKQVTRKMKTTGYCGCGYCCGWERGSWKFLKLDVWHRYVKTGKNRGKAYSGKTASGTKPREPVPGLFSVDSIKHPWMIPVRVILFPWFLLPKDGTIAADTKYHRFGTRMYVPGYGWGVVEDRGGAIKGANRLDLYFKSHRKALNWGKRNVDVIIQKK